MTRNGDRTERLSEDGCEALRGLLVLHADGEIDPPEARLVEAHVAACASCREALESHRYVRDALRAPEEAAIPDAPAIARRIRFLAQRRAFRTRAMGVGLAASLLLACAAFFTLEREGSRTAPVDEILGALDVLESFEAEGVEPTPELVDALLGPEPDAAESPADQTDLDALLDVLEDELSPENL